MIKSSETVLPHRFAALDHESRRIGKLSADPFTH